MAWKKKHEDEVKDRASRHKRSFEELMRCDQDAAVQSERLRLEPGGSLRWVKVMYELPCSAISPAANVPFLPHWLENWPSCGVIWKPGENHRLNNTAMSGFFSSFFFFLMKEVGEKFVQMKEIQEC